MQKELKTRQVCLFYIAFIPLSKLFVLPSILAKNASEDMWISALISLVIDFLTLIPIIICMRKTKTDFFTMLENSFGKIGSAIILFLYFIFFMIKGLMPINEQKEYVEMTLYTITPRVFYFLPYFAVAFYFCTKRLRAVGRAADILWFITIMGFILLFSLSVSNCDFGAILPIGAQGGGKIIKGTFSTFSWFGDSAYLLFFIGEFAYKERDGLKIFGAQILSGIIIIFFLVIFYAVFTSIAHRQRFALTEISKYTTVINNIGRFDYLAIMFILFSNLFALSLPSFFASRILNRIFNLPKKWIAPLITVGLQLAIMLLFTQYLASIESFIMSYGSAITFLIGTVLTIILPIIFIRRNKYADA